MNFIDFFFNGRLDLLLLCLISVQDVYLLALVVASCMASVNSMIWNVEYQNAHDMFEHLYVQNLPSHVWPANLTL